MAFPTKVSVFGTIFLSAPKAPPPSKAKILFLLSRRLWKTKKDRLGQTSPHRETPSPLRNTTPRIARRNRHNFRSEHREPLNVGRTPRGSCNRWGFEPIGRLTTASQNLCNGLLRPKTMWNTQHTTQEHMRLQDLCAGYGGILGRTPRGSCNRTLLRRVLRRFSNKKCFLEGFLEGAL